MNLDYITVRKNEQAFDVVQTLSQKETVLQSPLDEKTAEISAERFSSQNCPYILGDFSLEKLPCAIVWKQGEIGFSAVYLTEDDFRMIRSFGSKENCLYDAGQYAKTKGLNACLPESN